ncbi:MAG: glycyl radical protein [Clostridiales Family XIII bacterium]|jgi:formate C-acetyltransferase|nr:glycyl radical protein [Clostridiales Family XIII bacterium]
MIAKGFTNPTPRIEKLKRSIVEARPQVESERAVLVTEVYKETEDLPSVLRRAKVNERLYNDMHVTIRDDELIVGSLTKSIRSTEIAPEFSVDWIEEEFDTMATRIADPFDISEETKTNLHNAFEYWRGKTVFEFADAMMSDATKAAIDSKVFTVGNYQTGGVGHSIIDYEKVLKIGFSGIIKQTIEAMEKLDLSQTENISKQHFYESIIITFTAGINHAHRYADEAERLAALETDKTRKAELLQIAANCRRVPEFGARNFYEACQSFWFTHHLLRVESNGHSYSAGRFDQFMYPYYVNDETITEEFAQELIDNIWVKFNDCNKIRDAVTAQAFAGYQLFEHIGVGGQTDEGLDATNELSYLCLNAQAHVALPSPSFGIRYWNGAPDEFLLRACEVVRLGYGMPAMFNDEVIIPTLISKGIPLKKARTYAIEGCVEPIIAGETDGWTDAASFNLAKVLEIALHNGMCDGKQIGPVTGDPRTFQTMEDLYEAFDKQVDYFVKCMVEADNCVDLAHGIKNPMPYQSALISDCIGRGLPVQNGGANYNFSGPQAFGVADTGDSLYAIKKNVFEDKTMTMDQLLDALDHNFGYSLAKEDAQCQNTNEEAMEQKVYETVKRILASNGSINIADIKNQIGTETIDSGDCPVEIEKYAEIRRILQNTDSYGNDIDVVDFCAKRAARIYCDHVASHTNARGGQFRAGIYPVSANVLYGKDVLAQADGRLAYTPLADGVSPRAGEDTHGPTAAANSVAKLDHHLASNGTLYNQKFLPAALEGDTGLQNFAAMIRSYFEHKGMHVQFNVVDRKTLLDAQKNPDDYRDLVVRVAGYSAHFTVLAKEVQDNIIDRTEQVF